MIIKKVNSPTESLGWKALDSKYSNCSTAELKVIEIGGSNNTRSNQLARKCKELTIVELDPQRLPDLNEIENNINVKQGDWQQLSQVVAKEKYDILVASHVIEHVPDDLKAINETHTVLKDKGKALLLTPNINRLSRKFLDIFNKREFPWWEHQREYSYQSLKKLIEKSKFKNYKIEGIGLGLFAGGFNIGFKTPPEFLHPYANFWLVSLYK